VRVKTAGRRPSPSSGRRLCNRGNAARPATFRTLGPGPSAPRARRSTRQGHPRTAATRSITRMGKAHGGGRAEAPEALCRSSGRRTRFRKATFPQIRDTVWSGAGSNRRPSAFQVNRAKRCAELRKRTSLTSGTALGGRCKIHASRTRYTPSTRQDSDPTQDHRDRRWRDHGRHPVGARLWHVRSVPTPRATRRIPASKRVSGERRQINPVVSATARARSRLIVPEGASGCAVAFVRSDGLAPEPPADRA
jgi:hypothetical protein